MLQNIFMKVLEMSLVGCYSVLIVLAARELLWKCERKYSYYLWFIVFLNLCVPFTWRGDFSLIPRSIADFSLGENWQEEWLGDQDFQGSGDPEANLVGETGTDRLMAQSSGAYVPARPDGEGTEGLSGLVGNAVPGQHRRSAAPWSDPNGGFGFLDLAAVIWLLGIAVILGINVAEYLRLRRSLKKGQEISWDPERRIREIDNIHSAFLYGFFRPCIYLPAGMDESEKSYIIAHEQYHRRRKDYIIKPIALCITLMHWFNPLIWIALLLFCQDMEVSCDEKVLAHTDGKVRKRYAASLLKFAAMQSGFLITSLNFGKPALESRIRNVLKEKKKSVVLTVAAVLGVAVLALGLTVRPSDAKGNGDANQSNSEAQEGKESSGRTGDDAGSGKLGNEGTGSGKSGNEGTDADNRENNDGGSEEQEKNITEIFEIGQPCELADLGWDLGAALDVREEQAFSALSFPEEGADPGPVYLLAQSESYILYGSGDFESMLLQKGGEYSHIRFPYFSSLGVQPMIREEDFDNDGEKELSIILNVLSGTGVYIDSFLMADPGENGDLKVYQFLEDDYLTALTSHLTYRQTEDGTQALMDEALVGVPIFADEEKPFDEVYLGEQIYFTSDDAGMTITAPVEFHYEEWGWGIADYNGSSLKARIRYRDGGNFSLEAFRASNDELIDAAVKAVEGYYGNGYENGNGILFVSPGKKDPEAAALEIRFPMISGEEVLAVCRVRVKGRDCCLNIRMTRDEVFKEFIVGNVPWGVDEIWEEEGKAYELSQQQDAFLQDMCLTLPEFEEGTILDESFWHDFLFASYTGGEYLEGSGMTQLYREDLGFAEDQFRISRQEAQDRVRLALGVELPTYEPSLEEMPPRSTGFYYQNGYYYIGASDYPDVRYTLEDSEVYDIPVSQLDSSWPPYREIRVRYRLSDQEGDLGYMNFLLEAADNANHFVIRQKTLETL